MGLREYAAREFGTGNQGKQQDHEYASNHARPKRCLVTWPGGIRIRIVTFLLPLA
jgi:hypothetical protein